MNLWWKIGIALALLALNDAAVWRIHTWRDGFQEVKDVKAGQEATRRAMKDSNAIDTGFAASSAHLRQLELSANQSLEAIHEKPTSAGNCSINPARLSVLKAAIAARPSAR